MVAVGEKSKAHGLRSMGRLFLIDEKGKKADPPSAVGGLEGIVSGLEVKVGGLRAG